MCIRDRYKHVFKCLNLKHSPRLKLWKSYNSGYVVHKNENTFGNMTSENKKNKRIDKLRVNKSDRHAEIKIKCILLCVTQSDTKRKSGKFEEN